MERFENTDWKALNAKAVALTKAKQYDRARVAAQKALRLAEKTFGPDHPNVATSLTTLADLEKAQRRCEQAESLYKRALAIDEKVLGPDHPNVSKNLNNLMGLQVTRGKHEEALQNSKRILPALKREMGSKRPALVAGARLFFSLLDRFNPGKNPSGEENEQSSGFRKRIEIFTGHILTLLANFFADRHKKKGEYEKAEKLKKIALTFLEMVCGPNHPRVAKALESLARFYREIGREKKAKPLEARAAAIRAMK
jgi:tetratricopeptide (TPR) repeat protein